LREYDKKLVQILNTTGNLIMVDGVPVEVKQVPDDDVPNRLDPRVYKKELEMQKRMAMQTPPQDKDKPAESSYEEARKHMGDFNYNLNSVQIYTKHIEVPTSVGTVPVWIYYPRHMEGKRPAYIQVHGGAFFGGSPFELENHCRLIAELADCVTFDIDYGLAPENPYPIPCTQVYEVLCYIHDHAEDFSVNSEKIMMTGDSAGGNLVAVCAQMDRDKGTHYLKAQVLIYAKLTFTNHLLPGYCRDESVFEIIDEQKELLPGLLHIGSDVSNAGDEEVYVQGKYDITTPYISPAFGAKERLPQTLFIQAGYDGLRLEGEFYAKQLMEAGVPVRMIRYCGVNHGFFDLLGVLPQVEAAVNEIVGMLKTL
jgi:acetyl esterase/lipase